MEWWYGRLIMLGTVLAALQDVVWREIVVGSVECTIDGTVICMLDDALFRFLLLLLKVDFVDALGTCPNVNVYPVVSNWWMERRDSRNIGV